MSYSRAGYLCDLAFSYQLVGEGEVNLRLQTSSSVIVWSTNTARSSWEAVGLQDSHYLTSHVDERIEFVLTSDGASASVALDNMDLTFCLPCDLGALQTGMGFKLNYDNYTRIYLRTPQTMNIEVYLFYKLLEISTLPPKHLHTLPFP